jgi:predicted nuclease of predicted toxin-antitoxin system
MKFIIDMNLTPEWIKVFQDKGYEAVHWSHVGKNNAMDREIMDYAQRNGYIVFTHDLDFGDILAATDVSGPSVIQIRTSDTTPGHLSPILFKALSQYENFLKTGALITLSPSKMRARILPLRI